MNLIFETRLTRHSRLFFFITALVLIYQGADGELYGAAVVEYQYTADANSPVQTLLNNVNQYVSIIHQFKRKLTTQLKVEKGIIVFPEVGLTAELNVSELYVPVPDPSYQYPNLTGNQVVSTLSQAAKDTGLYVVVNLLEASGQKRYNTDVVFRSNGTIAARYRKFNLYGEPVDKPPKAEVVSFLTDFNVTFGIFICFDILYQHPAEDLVKQGVKHFVFSSAWYSELPFLTAVQYQMSWSWMNDVTLLASGRGNTLVGHTGSGIYLGRKGPLEYYQANLTVGSVLISAVLDSSLPGIGLNSSINLLDQPKSIDKSQLDASSIDPKVLEATNSGNGEVLISDMMGEKDVYVVKKVPNKVDVVGKGLQLKKEPLNAFTMELIEPEGCVYQGNISSVPSGQLINCTRRMERYLCNRGFCCSFDLTSVFTVCKHPCHVVPRFVSDDFSQSNHKLVVFNGVRSFDVTTGGLQTCGIVSCLDMDEFSCGLPSSLIYLDTPLRILYRYIVHVKIEGFFDNNNTFISPNILLGHNQHDDTDSLPTFGILSNNFTMKVNDSGYAIMEYESDSPHPLGTVAIFNRVYDRDGQPASTAPPTTILPRCLFLFLTLIPIFRQG